MISAVVFGVSLIEYFFERNEYKEKYSLNALSYANTDEIAVDTEYLFKMRIVMLASLIVFILSYWSWRILQKNLKQLLC